MSDTVHIGRIYFADDRGAIPLNVGEVDEYWPFFYSRSVGIEVETDEGKAAYPWHTILRTTNTKETITA